MISQCDCSAAWRSSVPSAGPPFKVKSAKSFQEFQTVKIPYLSQKLQAMRQVRIIPLIHPDLMTLSGVLQSFAYCGQAVKLMEPCEQLACLPM